MTKWLLVLAWFFSYTLHNQDGKVIDLVLVGDEVAVVTQPAIVRHTIGKGFDTDVHCDRVRQMMAVKLDPANLAPGITGIVDPECWSDRVEGRRPR